MEISGLDFSSPRDSIDGLDPRTLANEQSKMLVTELGLSDCALHLLTEEEAMIQYSHPSFFIASVCQSNLMQSSLAHQHEYFQPQLAPYPDDFSRPVLPSQLPLKRKSTDGPKPTRQTTIRKRARFSKAQRNDIREYCLNNRGVKQQEIADLFACDRSTISKIKNEDKPQTWHQKAAALGCGRDDPSASAVSDPEAAFDEEKHSDHHLTLAGQSLQPLENDSLPDMIPTREEARQALYIAIQALKIHTGGLDENELSVMQSIEGYLNTNK